LILILCESDMNVFLLHCASLPYRLCEGIVCYFMG